MNVPRNINGSLKLGERELNQIAWESTISCSEGVGWHTKGYRKEGSLTYVYIRQNGRIIDRFKQI